MRRYMFCSFFSLKGLIKASDEIKHQPCCKGLQLCVSVCLCVCSALSAEKKTTYGHNKEAIMALCFVDIHRKKSVFMKGKQIINRLLDDQ